MACLQRQGAFMPLLAHLYELMPDQRLVFMRANKAAESILGVDHQQFIGKMIEEAFPSTIGP